jgi:hypothetical protein
MFFEDISEVLMSLWKNTVCALLLSLISNGAFAQSKDWHGYPAGTQISIDGRVFVNGSERKDLEGAHLVTMLNKMAKEKQAAKPIPWVVLDDSPGVKQASLVTSTGENGQLVLECMSGDAQVRSNVIPPLFQFTYPFSTPLTKGNQYTVNLYINGKKISSYQFVVWDMYTLGLRNNDIHSLGSDIEDARIIRIEIPNLHFTETFRATNSDVVVDRTLQGCI